MSKIFVVEDDESIRELVVYALQTSGFEPTAFENSTLFWRQLATNVPDLMLLDVMLPDEDGFSIVKKLKADNRTKQIPIIMLTAKTGEHDRIKGLNMGADDYISKPFSVLELIARIHAVLRRSGTPVQDDSLSFETIVIHPERRLVFSDGESVLLTYKEFELLLYLLQNKGIVLSRDKLIEHIWGYDVEVETRTVDMHIKTLRQKLGANGESIKTVRGVGYKMGG